jgi:4-oxalocrotonate tautomerase
MPHITLEIAPGTSEQQKYQLAQEFAKAVTKVLGVPDQNISVAIDEVSTVKPDIIVKLWPGRTDQQKHQVAEAFAKAAKTFGVSQNIPVTFKEIAPEEWKAKVWTPEIENNPGHLYKKPNYNPDTLRP